MMKTNQLELNNFSENGCAVLGVLFPEKECRNLRAWINERRPVKSEIFYPTQAKFEKNGRWHRYAPGTDDHNLLLSKELDLGFIENAPEFMDAAKALVGKNYRIMKKSIIRSVPGQILPEWIYEYVKDVGRPNLNPFVFDQYQDVQYFHATDYHQDKTRETSNFVTVYIYLDEVDASYSALRVLSGSHLLGMTIYPHSLRRSADSNTWFYSDTEGHHMRCNEIVVEGHSGSAFVFHGLTLHGTVLNNSKDPRISLRYLLTPGEPNDTCLLSKANQLIQGPQFISKNRTDVGPNGAFLRTGSSLLASSYEKI